VCRVLLEVLGVHCAEIVRVFRLVFLHVGMIDPLERVHEPGRLSALCLCSQDLASLHAVQGGRDITHHCHKEERHLEDGMLKEVKPIHYAFVPSNMVHVHKQRDDP
jgi:hypothetical protein